MVIKKREREGGGEIFLISKRVIKILIPSRSRGMCV